MNTSATKSKPGRARRWTTLGIAVLGVVGLVTASVWAYRSHGKQKLIEAIKQDPSKIREIRESGALSRQEVRDVMEQAFEERANKEMDAYFAMADQKSRQAYLDKLIDERQAQMRQWQERAATQPARERPTTGPSTRP